MFSVCTQVYGKKNSTTKSKYSLEQSKQMMEICTEIGKSLPKGKSLYGALCSKPSKYTGILLTILLIMKKKGI